ncbi:hypothetical protein M0812_28452 [Anaeramoeba flamelloides]|uniref:BTB domain-containing protein n=1 Tax=Anaeramoeba flamelloides TaxID=1746091 RepID=A0AAV7YAS5_9EUKA|nr:hypothetical protein M0812_28452 [Anaeramoeba flamelloides]
MEPKKDFFNFFTQEKNKNNLPKWSESSIKKTQTIKKIVSGKSSNFLVWKKPNKLEFYQKDKKKRKYQLPKNETIKDIVSSCYTYLILTESGKVWSLAKSNRYKVVPFLDVDQSTFEKISTVTFFEEKKLFVNSVVMGFASCYYLCNGDQLYASGSNSYGSLGLGENSFEEPMPVYVQDKVIKIFAGFFSFGFFFITSQPDLLYACGKTAGGQLGIGSCVEKQKTPTAVKNIKGFEILTVSSGDRHSTLITKKGQTFGYGQQVTNGIGVQKKIFTLIPQLKEKKAVQLSIGTRQTFVLTDQNELYAWGYNGLFPTDQFNKIFQKLPTKIKLPDDDSKDFKILVKIEYEQDEEEDNDEEEVEEENYEEIPEHKFILLARSGLFREMFDYVNEKDNTNKVQDYTNKSIKSLKILIKYFYTNSIELTTDQDPKLIVEELSDAVEYYQFK